MERDVSVKLNLNETSHTTAIFDSGWREAADGSKKCGFLSQEKMILKRLPFVIEFKKINFIVFLWVRISNSSFIRFAHEFVVGGAVLVYQSIIKQYIFISELI
jgi:hypothetical protein